MLIRVCNCSCRYQQPVNGTGPPRWLLCQATTVQRPGTNEPLTTLIQLDITDTRKVKDQQPCGDRSNSSRGFSWLTGSVAVSMAAGILAASHTRGVMQ